MFEAVYITDRQHNLVYEYLVLPEAPRFKSLLSAIRAKYGDLDPQPLIEINSDYFVCTQPTTNLWVFLLCLLLYNGGSYNPLIAYVLIQRLLEVMREYFGAPLTSTKIDANSDTLTLLINEMIDDGIPHVTDFNRLRDLVLLKSFLSRILSTSNDLATAATSKSLASLLRPTHVQPDTEVIPWRRSNVKYTNNEVFVDVIEHVSVILRPRKGKRLPSGHNLDSAFYSLSNVSSGHRLVPVTGSISGKIDCLCHISGVPQLQVLLGSVSSYIGTPQFHPCIRQETWTKSRSLSFIPPDGQSTLMTYLVDLDVLPEQTQLDMLGLVEFDCQLELGLHLNEFEARIIVLKHHNVPKIESITVEVCAFEPASDSEDNSVVGMRTIRVTHGDFVYKGNGKGEWTIKNIATGNHALLRGSITTKETREEHSETSSEENVADDKRKPVSPSHYNLSFSYKGHTASGLTVDSLKVVSNKGMSGSVKPYKGVKYIAKSGDFTIRLR